MAGAASTFTFFAGAYRLAKAGKIRLPADLPLERGLKDKIGPVEGRHRAG